jgi:hypothetical protein
LITQGSRLHGSSKLYNHRAQGCEGELVDAAVSCGVQFVTQRPPAESLGNAVVTAESLGIAVVTAESLGIAVVTAESLGNAVVTAESLGIAVVTAESLGNAVVTAEFT